MPVFEMFIFTGCRAGLRMCAGGMAILLALGSSGYAEEELIGADEYRVSCQACHGVGGKGDGPMAEYLNVPPSNLTQIAKNNDGDFPLSEIYEVIDGRRDVRVHGTSGAEGGDMPVWGSRYNAEMVARLDPFDPADMEVIERLVRGRVLELVYYLQSIQQ